MLPILKTHDNMLAHDCCLPLGNIFQIGAFTYHRFILLIYVGYFKIDLLNYNLSVNKEISSREPFDEVTHNGKSKVMF